MFDRDQYRRQLVRHTRAKAQDWADRAVMREQEGRHELARTCRRGAQVRTAEADHDAARYGIDE